MKTLSYRPLNDHGMGGLEVLMTLVVVLVMMGVGTYVYTRQNSTKTANTAKSGSSSASSEGTPNATAPNGVPPAASGGTSSSGKTSSSPSTSTIKVTEGGLQITVPDSLKDLTWHSTSSGGVITTNFSTKTLTKAVPNCAADKGNGAFDTILRGKGQYPGPANPSSGGLLKQYGDYYLAYVLPNAPCAEDLSTENQALVDHQAETFYDTMSTIQGL